MISSKAFIELFKDQPFQNLTQRRQDCYWSIILGLEGTFLFMEGDDLSIFPACREFLLHKSQTNSSLGIVILSSVQRSQPAALQTKPVHYCHVVFGINP